MSSDLSRLCYLINEINKLGAQQDSNWSKYCYRLNKGFNESEIEYYKLKHSEFKEKRSKLMKETKKERLDLMRKLNAQVIKNGISSTFAYININHGDKWLNRHKEIPEIALQYEADIEIEKMLLTDIK